MARALDGSYDTWRFLLRGFPTEAIKDFWNSCYREKHLLVAQMGTSIVFFGKETGPISPSTGDGNLKANYVGKIGKSALRFLSQFSLSIQESYSS